VQELGPITFVNAAPTLSFLVRAHMFGKKTKDRRWLNDVIDAFIRVHSEARLTAALPELFHCVCECSHKKSPIWKLLADMEAYNMTEGEDMKAKYEGLPLEFTLDVRQAFVKFRPAKQTEWWTHLGDNVERYHAKV
jgi:hypothetical protein